jgi:hypothetical protein
MGKNNSLFGEIWAFMRVRKKWWLLPLVIVFVLVAVLIIFSTSSPISPFIYSLF